MMRAQRRVGASAAALIMLGALTGCDSGDGGTGGGGASTGTSGTGATTGIGPVIEPKNNSMFVEIVDRDGAGVSLVAMTLIPPTPDDPKPKTLPTNGAGQIVFEDLPASRVVVRAEALDYAPSSVVLDFTGGKDVHAGIRPRLVKLEPRQPFSEDVGTTLIYGTIKLIIPPNALIHQDGEEVTGTVDATITPLLLPDDQALLPGTSEGASLTGSSVNVDHLTAADIAFWQGRTPLKLKWDKPITAEMVISDALAPNVQIGDVIPGVFFDLDAGLWREETKGTIIESTFTSGKLAWLGSLPHLSWWSASTLWTEKNCFHVTLKDGDNHVWPGKAILPKNSAGEGTPKLTDTQGAACVEIKLLDTAQLLAGSDSATPIASTTVTGTGPASACSNQGATCGTAELKAPMGVTPDCVPGAKKTCLYSDPTKTPGVGQCQAATAYCNTDGTEWLPCMGEVLAALNEDCNTAWDDNCNGVANEYGGIGCKCTAGEIKSTGCYTGPKHTIGKGKCKVGVATCNAFLNGFTCEGEVLPSAAEQCNTPDVDDDCDGYTWCPYWSRTFGSSLIDLPAGGAAIDSSTGVFIMGEHRGQFMVDSSMAYVEGSPTAVKAFGNTDVFIVKLDRSGVPEWGKGFGSPGEDYAGRLALDSEGNVWLAGSTNGSIDFGNGPSANPVDGARDIFLAELSATGGYISSKHFKGTGHDAAISMALDKNDPSKNKVLLTGYFTASTTPGATTLTFSPLPALPFATPDNKRHIFVAKLDKTGLPEWSRAFGEPGAEQTGGDIAVDSTNGEIIVAGRFNGAIKFNKTAPDPDLAADLTATGTDNLFVIKLDSTGKALWSKSYVTDIWTIGDVDWVRVAVDANQDIIVVGSYEQTFEAEPADGRNIFVLKLKSDGTEDWRELLGLSGDQAVRSVGLDKDNNIVITGFNDGLLQFKGGKSITPTDGPLFLAKLDTSTRDGLYAHPFSTTGSHTGLFALPVTELDGTQTVVLGGQVDSLGDLTFGSLNSTLIPQGKYDVFVAKIVP